jgi:cyclopropane-fatty-acyl-phospholipid synthase
VIQEREHNWAFGQGEEAASLTARIRVQDPRFYWKALVGGSVGAGEAYMAGWWSAEDLTALLRLALRNQAFFRGLDRGWAWLSEPANRLFHFLRRNTRRGSRGNIRAHYDLGNDFYALFLDDTLTYSCGIFDRSDSSLRDASLAKYDRICRKLRLSAGDRVLEIGTGWGGFAIHAAGQYGCHVTTTTISRAQHELAVKRVADAGLCDRVELRLDDYRDLRGRYDKLVSIEMIEAVGHHYLEDFFRCCSDRLKPDGVMLLQAITIADRAYERHTRSVDFIKRYIFPGSCIPSVAAMMGAVARSTDLRLVHLEDITPHYARTLRAWRDQFLHNSDAVRSLGYSDAFIRMWEFYLRYCEAGFAERYLGDVQMLFTKPLWRGEPILSTLPSPDPDPVP